MKRFNAISRILKHVEEDKLMFDNNEDEEESKSETDHNEDQPTILEPKAILNKFSSSIVHIAFFLY